MSNTELVALRRAGFDFVRLTVDPSIFIAAMPEQRPLLERHARETVAQVLASGLDVVFDLHPVGVNPSFAPRLLVDPRGGEIFAAYLDMVERIAGALRDFPLDRVALELFNEPWLSNLGETPRWERMLVSLHARARVGDPARALILNGLQWDSAEALQALNIRPFHDSNVIYTFHYYDPHAFTHQGVAGDTQWISGLRWPTEPDNARSVLTSALTRIGSDSTLDVRAKAQARSETQAYVDQLLRSRPGAAKIFQDVEAVARWAAANGVSPNRVLLGEFGCVESTADHTLGEDRLQWLRSVRVAAERAGFGWAYWAYKGNGGMELIRADGSLDRATLDALGLN